MAATSCRLANMVSPRVGAADRDDSLGVLILTGGVQVPLRQVESRWLTAALGAFGVSCSWNTVTGLYGTLAV
jgi:hypothetical protein